METVETEQTSEGRSTEGLRAPMLLTCCQPGSQRRKPRPRCLFHPQQRGPSSGALRLPHNVQGPCKLAAVCSAQARHPVGALSSGLSEHPGASITTSPLHRGGGWAGSPDLLQAAADVGSQLCSQYSTGRSVVNSELTIRGLRPTCPLSSLPLSIFTCNFHDFLTLEVWEQ